MYILFHPFSIPSFAVAVHFLFTAVARRFATFYVASTLLTLLTITKSFPIFPSFASFLLQFYLKANYKQLSVLFIFLLLSFSPCECICVCVLKRVWLCEGLYVDRYMRQFYWRWCVAAITAALEVFRNVISFFYNFLWREIEMMPE